MHIIAAHEMLVRKTEIPLLRVGDLEIDALRHRATRAGAELKLSEFSFEDVFWPPFRQIDFFESAASFSAPPTAFCKMNKFVSVLLSNRPFCRNL
jgi:hypothetical protein